MKRLATSYLRQERVTFEHGPDPDRWNIYSRQLAQRGIDEVRVRGILACASWGRRLLEDTWDAIERNRQDTKDVKSRMAKVRILDQAILVIKQYSSSASELQHLETVLIEYRKQILLPISSDLFTPRNRPRELWLDRAVSALIPLMQGKVSKTSLPKFIYEGFASFRHDDQVTQEQIRHRIRQFTPSHQAR